jgi:hypothetical protein
MRVILLVALCLVFPFISYGTITEIEPNSDFDHAILVNRDSIPWSDNGTMSLTTGGGDVDFFVIDLTAGEKITISTTLDNNSPDTYLGFFNTSKTLVAWNDNIDDITNKGSIIEYSATSTGTYYFAVTGTPDGSDKTFDGKYYGIYNHTRAGNYLLSVSIVPEPVSLVLLGCGVLGLARRRSEKKSRH